MQRLALVVTTSALLSCASVGFSSEADVGKFRDSVAPFLKQYCIDCHGPDTTEGKLPLHNLTGNLQGIGQTYFNSLVLSAKEGVGNPYCSHTLSFNRLGAPIPAQSKPAEIFARLFPPHGQASRQDILNRFQRKRSILDMALEEASSLKRKLGAQDQTRLDEYLESVRSVEKRIQIKQEIVSRPPTPLLDGVKAPPPNQMPNATTWTETMLDRIVLALQTDLTHVVTFATGVDDPHNGGLPVEWPEFQEVFKMNGAKDRHNVAHSAKSGGKKGIDGTVAQTKMDTFWTARFA